MYLLNFVKSPCVILSSSMWQAGFTYRSYEEYKIYRFFHT